MNNGSLVYKVSNAPGEESSFTLYTINKIAKIGKQQPLLESPFSDDALFKRSLVFFFVTRYAVKNFTRLSLLGLLMYYIPDTLHSRKN